MRTFAILFALALMSLVSSFSMLKTSSFTARRSELVMRERKCDLAGTRQNSKCNNVSKSRAHTHRIQNVNLQSRKLWWEEGNKFVKIRISTRTLKTVQKNGLHATAKKFGIDLNKFSLSSGTAPPKVVAEEIIKV